MIRLYLIDEQPVVLAGVRSFLVGTEFQVVGEACVTAGLLKELKRLGPQIVVIDPAQQEFSDMIEPIRCKYKVVELTGTLKTQPKEFLIAALKAVTPKRVAVRGRRILPPKSTKLTPRETEVLRLIVQGLSNKEIGRQLDIVVDTVKEHIQNILRKTGLSDRTQAALWAVQHEIASL